MNNIGQTCLLCFSKEPLQYKIFPSLLLSEWDTCAFYLLPTAGWYSLGLVSALQALCIPEQQQCAEHSPHLMYTEVNTGLDSFPVAVAGISPDFQEFVL